MIDFNAFFKYLWTHKWWVVAAVIVSVAVTFFLVKNMPEEYKSEAQIASEGPQLLSPQNVTVRSDAYGDISGLIRMRRILNLLSYRLILHDLESPSEAFRAFPDELASVVDTKRKELVLEYKKRLYTKSILTVKDNGSLPLFDLVNDMGYGEKSFEDALSVNQGASNNITTVSFVSESPELSVFAVNTLATEFILYYNTVTAANRNNTMRLLDSIMRDKQQIMNEKNAQLQSYKSHSGVLNAATQSGIAYEQVAEYETKLSQTLQEIASYKGAIVRINRQLENLDTQTLDAKVNTPNNLLEIDDQINKANQKYTENGFRSEEKQLIDSLQQQRLRLLSANPGRNSQTSAMTTRQSLITERLRLETSLAMAEGRVPSIERELSTVRQKYNLLVPTDAGIQQYEREAAVATQEYTDALNRYNQAGLENSAGRKLNLIEPGLPSLPEPSKKKIYIGLSGAGGLSLSIFILFIAFIVDRRILNAEQLAQATKGPVFGNLNLIREKDLDIRNIWQDRGTIPDYTLYKDLLRSLRFEINKQLAKEGGKVLGITSLNSDDGKTFITAGLAYAFAMTGKKVLLIGEQYSDVLSVLKGSNGNPETGEFEKFLVKKEITIEDFITVLNKNPDTTSLLEMNEARNLIEGVSLLREKFDIIIIDINSLKDMNKVREWMMFVDKSLAVFAWGNSIENEDSEFISFISQQPSFMGWLLNKIPVKQKVQKLRA